MSTRYICDWCEAEFGNRDHVAHVDLTVDTHAESLHMCGRCAPDHLASHFPPESEPGGDEQLATDGGLPAWATTMQTVDGSDVVRCTTCGGEGDDVVGVKHLKSCPEEDPQPTPVDFESVVDEILQDANDPESHIERDPHTFHPSQIARCKRRAYCSKLGLEDQSDILGIFQTGTLIHEFLEEFLADHLPQAEFETEILDTRGQVQFVGQADCYDPERNAVYDFKTRNGWYNFDPPTQRHLDQLYIYMAALDADYGQVVYLSKGDMEVRTWPEDRLFKFDGDRYYWLVEKAHDIMAAIDENGIAKSPDEIPFERCECYFCSQETLRFEGGDE
jgi:hypothetical protein